MNDLYANPGGSSQTNLLDNSFNRNAGGGNFVNQAAPGFSNNAAS